MIGIPGILKTHLSGQNFRSNVLMLAGGTALGQGLIILASPLLTRLYTPEDFGMLAAYVSILSLLSAFVSLRYVLAIPLAQDETTASNILVLSLLIVLIMSLLIGLGVQFFGDHIAILVKSPELGFYLWLLPVSLLGTGLYQALSYWAMRKKAFVRLAHTRLTQSLGQVLIQTTLGIFKMGLLGLLLGEVAGRAGGSGNLATLAWRQDSDSFKKVSIPGIRQAAYRYRRFPLLSSGSALLNIAGLQLPPLLIVMLYGPQVAGWFALAQRVISLPMSLIGHSVAQVYFGEASRLANENPKGLQNLFLKTAKKLVAWGFVPIVLLSLLGPWLFVLVFGETWHEAGVYVQLLSFMFLLKFVMGPLSQTLNILEKQDWQLAWDAGRLVLVISVLLISFSLGFTARGTLLAYSVAMLVVYAGLFVLSNIAIVKRLRTKK